MTDEKEQIFTKGVNAINEGNTLLALSIFEKLASSNPTPVINSYYAYCIARERGLVKNAINICKEALEKEPENPYIYLNLGRIYIVSKNIPEAIRILREGLSKGRDDFLIAELNKLGTRRRPILPFLSRKNPINKYLGLIASRLFKKGTKT